MKQKQNRELIKNWLLRIIVLKPFRGSGDTVLANMRKAFIKDFKQTNERYFDEKLDLFPLKEIEKEAKYSQPIDEEYLENIIVDVRKNSPEAFAFLSLLFKNFKEDIQTHIDHLHPISAYKNNSKKERKEYESRADTLPNLQLLEGGENMSKNDMPLEEWLEKNCADDKEAFLKRHLIPEDVDLSLENFDEFYEKRKKLFIRELIKILNN